MPGKRKKIDKSGAKLIIESDESNLLSSSIELKSKNQETSKSSNETKPEEQVTFQVTFEPELWEKVWRIEQQLCEELNKINFSSDKNIGAIYNPLDYAEDIHKNFMKMFLKKAPSVIFLGMNPGLFGMCQTSIPFGHVPSVKNWMKVTGEIRKPANEIPEKPIEGLNCTREEQSGKRFWGVIEELCGEPENFFRHCFVYNLCPFAFLHKSGRNITPPEIKGESKSQLTRVCLEYLRQVIEVFNPKIIISVGSYANDRVKDLKKKSQLNPSINCKLIPHPSPRAINNQDWVEKAKKWYIDNDIIKYFEKN